MNKIFFTILILITFAGSFFAQPNIRIEPRNIQFEDVFSRYDYTYIFNDGDQILYIDSLSLTSPYYILEFNDQRKPPIALNPGDTIRLNITLTNFYNITVSDTADTVWVYSNDPENPRDIRVKIDFFDDDFGNCFGLITDENSNPISNSNVYFFYYGIYLFDSTSTDISGFYTKQLPKGNYTVATEKEGHRVMFSGNTSDPFFALPVNLDSGQTLNVDIQMPTINSSGFSVSGVVFDSTYGNPIEKGVVIIRKGTHTPTLMKPTAPNADSSVYAGFIKSDGSYDVIVEDSSYYYVQGYSEYYLPTYYNNQNIASVFWQNADSLKLNQTITNKNLYLVRDSSYGGGSAYGYISLPVIEAYGKDGISLFAQSTANNQLYSYNFGKADGDYGINNLPYGTYRIVAQKVGFPNSYSNEFSISPANPDQRGLTITFTLSDVGEYNVIPTGITLLPNYPNPFNPSTIISYSIPQSTYVVLKIYDILGSEVVTLVNDHQHAGMYNIRFDASGLSNGVYFYTIKTENFTSTKKMLLLK